jgi:hypothetical protein
LTTDFSKIWTVTKFDPFLPWITWTAKDDDKGSFSIIPDITPNMIPPSGHSYVTIEFTIPNKKSPSCLTSVPNPLSENQTPFVTLRQNSLRPSGVQ